MSNVWYAQPIFHRRRVPSSREAEERFEFHLGDRELRCGFGTGSRSDVQGRARLATMHERGGAQIKEKRM